MELKLNLTFDEDKLRELVEEAVARLKAEGYIWKDKPQPMVLPDTPTIGGIDGRINSQRETGL